MRARTPATPPPVPSPIEVEETVAIEPRVDTDGNEATTARTWKIRTPVGLVYDFPDLDALKAWLATRENVDGMVASIDDGKTWLDMRSYSQLETALPKGARRQRQDVTSASADTAVAEAMDAVLASRGSALGTAKTPAAAKPNSGPATKPPPRKLEASTILEKPRRSPSPVAGLEPGQPIPRPAPRPAGAPGRQRPRPVLRRGRPASPPKSAGIGTYVGLLVCMLIIVAGALQLTGAVDVADILGLRKPPAPNTVVEASADETVSTDVQAAVTGDETEVYGDEYLGGAADDSDYLVDNTQFGADAPSQDPAQLVAQGINPHRARITVLVNRAIETAERGNLEEAIQLVSGAAQLSPGDPDLICLLSEFHRRNGSNVESEALRGQCLTLRAAQDTAEARSPSYGGYDVQEPSALQTQ